MAQAAEAIQMLSAIIKFRTTHSPNTVKNATFTLAKVHYSASQIEKAKDLGNKALDGTFMHSLLFSFTINLNHNNISPSWIAFESALGREHSTTVEVRNFLKIVNASKR